MKRISHIKGFTLVELTIVMVIVGLIIAGIAGGKSLIDQARLRSVISEMDEYNTAYMNITLHTVTLKIDTKPFQET